MLFSAVRSPQTKAAILAELEPSRVMELITAYQPKEIAEIFQEFESDDAAYILNNLPEETSEEILKIMKAADAREASQIEDLLKYEPNTAGSLMNVDVFCARMDQTIGEVISTIQSNSEKEFLFYLYVVGEGNNLVGVLSLRQLLMHKPEVMLKDIMNSQVIRVTPEVEQSEVARIVSSYDLLAVPVVDEHNALIGMITVDDVLDVIKDEAAQDILQMTGTGGAETDILEKSVWKSFRSRAPWLLIPTLLGLGNVLILSRFTHKVEHALLAIAFVPLIAALGGNTATQTAGTVIRGLSYGEISRSQMWSMVWHDLRVVWMIGLTYGLLVLGFGFLVGKDVPWIALVSAAASWTTILVSSGIGLGIPLILKRLDFDPTAATTTLCNALMDIVASVIFVQFFLIGMRALNG
jgi:magnesium transporter